MHRGRTMLLWVGLLSLGGLWPISAADPHIEKIETYGARKDQVLLHFATVPDRTTALQYTSDLRAPVQWVTLDLSSGALSSPLHRA